MKRLIGPLVVAALLIAGAQVLRRHQNSPLVSPAERQALRDAPNDNNDLPNIHRPDKLHLTGAQGMAGDNAQAGKLDAPINLSDYTGQTYLQFLMAPAGLKKALDADVTTKFTFAGKDAVHSAAGNFDPKVYRKIVGLFKDGEPGLDKLLDSLAGASATPATAAGVIAGRLTALDLLADPGTIGLSAVSLAPFLSLASGAGVAVKINEQNFYYNIGYKPGMETDQAQVDKDVKSGRSYGISPDQKALDVSDSDYLKGLHSYIISSDYSPDFYRTILMMIAKCDASGYATLSSPAQTMATDFIAVYTAELDRNAMTGFEARAWENDLAEVTLLSAYCSAAHKVVLNDKFIDGEPKDFFGKSQYTTGTGIGITRKDRQELQRAVANVERKLHPEVVARLEALLGGQPGGDVIHRLMQALNDPGQQALVQKNADQLVSAVIEFISQIRADAAPITSKVETLGISAAATEVK